MNILVGAIVILANNAAPNTGFEFDLSSLLVGALGGIIASLLAYLGHSLYVVPKQRYNELRGKIVECLVFYANVYATVLPLNETSESRRHDIEIAKKEIRHLAAEIYAYSYSSKWLYKLFVPRTKGIREAAAMLIGISNELTPCEGINVGKENRELADKIRKIFRIKVNGNG
ncbi:MAG: hypothetical protein IKO47_13580 [Ruminococcus sp.]|nr:hypothetical protein [Ruminococcus sp.]